MRFFGRLIFAVACGALTLQPAAALATPSPSPGLSGILASPPTADYVEADATVPGVVEGQFDAKTFASRSGHGGFRRSAGAFWWSSSWRSLAATEPTNG